MKKPKPSKAPTLELEASPGKSPERQVADLMVAGEGSSAFVATLFSKGTYGEVSLTEAVRSLRETSSALRAGDLGAAEGLLVAQAVALNAMFAEMSRRAALNMGEYLPAMEAYMRLALRAQAQTRATVETLAAIKNPPVVFARQANISGGHQQVVNGSIGATVRAPAGESPEAPNELLEASHGQRLDTGAKGEAGGADRRLAPVGAVHRAADT